MLNKVLHSKLYRIIFGYDIFISYSRKDSLDYAYSISKHFMDKGYACYIDQLSSISPGKQLPSNIKNAVSNSTAFVLIGSEGAKLSEPIDNEIELFLNHNKNKPVIPITIDGNINVSARWFDRINGLAFIDDTTENLQIGIPSPEILERIQNALLFTKKSAKIRNLTWIILATVLIISGLAFMYARYHLNKADIAIQNQEKAEIETGKQTKIASEAISNSETAKSSQLEAECLQREAEIETSLALAVKRSAEKRAAKLDAHSKMLQTRIAAYNQVEHDPIIAFRLAKHAYDISPDLENRKLVFSALSKIDLYYRFSKDSFVIEDFKNPYILLSKYESDTEEKSFQIYDIENSRFTLFNKTASRAWIIPLENGWRILTESGQVEDFLRDFHLPAVIPLYQLWNEDGIPISNAKMSNVDRKFNFIDKSRVIFSLYYTEEREEKFLIWDLIKNEIDTIESLDSKEYKSGRGTYISETFDVRKDGYSFLYEDNKIVLVNDSGFQLPHTLTTVKEFNNQSEFRFSYINFTSAKWSADEKYLALFNEDVGNLGIWSPENKIFTWANTENWIAEQYVWSLKGDLLAFSGHLESTGNYTVELANGEGLAATRKVIYQSKVPIVAIAFVLDDERIAILDKEGNINILLTSSGQHLSKGIQKGVFNLFSSGEALYSSAQDEFRIWATNEAPSKHWKFISTDARKYNLMGSGDIEYKWLAVPFVESDTLNGVEVRNTRSGKVISLIAPAGEIYDIKFSKNGDYLLLVLEEQIRIWNTADWKAYDFQFVEGDDRFLDVSIGIDCYYVGVETEEFDYAIYTIKLDEEFPVFKNRELYDDFQNSDLLVGDIQHLVTGVNPDYMIATSLWSYSEENYNLELLNQIEGWDIGNTHMYQGVVLRATPGLGWAICIKSLDISKSRLAEIQFVPLEIEKLSKLYDGLVWNPSEKELEKFGLIK